MTLEGAALIAQVYPVAILLVVLETRRVKSRKLPSTTAGAILFAARTSLRTLALVASICTVALCVIAVAEHQAPAAWLTLVAAISGFALLAFAIGLAGDLIVDDFTSRLDRSPWAKAMKKWRLAMASSDDDDVAIDEDASDGSRASRAPRSSTARVPGPVHSGKRRPSRRKSQDRDD